MPRIDDTIAQLLLYLDSEVASLHKDIDEGEEWDSGYIAGFKAAVEIVYNFLSV